MIRRLSTASLMLVAVLALAVPARAQLSENEIQIVELDPSGYPTVTAVVDVPRSFADTELTSEHFSLEEGGVAREIAVEKLAETTAVVLAIDTSGSMGGAPLEAAKAAALKFVDGLPARNPVAVVGFGDTANIASELTTDRAGTRAAIESLSSAGETSLYDSLVSGAAILAEAPTDRFAMVLLSDGADTASGAGPP